MDLNSISQNLLIFGFAIVSICCLYLLYVHFKKIRELEEFKLKIEDLKNIFFNQQKCNDEIQTKMFQMLKSTSEELTLNNNPNTNPNANLNANLNDLYNNDMIPMEMHIHWREEFNGNFP